MNIYLLSPINKSTKELFPTFIKTFEEQGHTFTSGVYDSTVCFMDLFSGLGEYNQSVLNEIVERKIPIVYFDAFDYGGCKDGTEEWFGFDAMKYKGTAWCDFFWRTIAYCKVVYFMRKKDKTKDYPKWVYSYELTMYEDHIFEPVTADELFNRPYDIFFAGNESPARRSVYEGLKDTGLKLDWYWSNEGGKLPHDEWVNRARQSKLFAACDGGGYNCERIYQLIYTGVLLKQRNNQFVLRDFTHGFSCLKVSEIPLSHEIDFIQKILSNKERLHNIYTLGIKNIEKYYNPQFRASYILQVLFQNGIN
ncbi:MAG: hypothetical protein V4538_15145 [Bacteroidota bacterium]